MSGIKKAQESLAQDKLWRRIKAPDGAPLYYVFDTGTSRWRTPCH